MTAPSSTRTLALKPMTGEPAPTVAMADRALFLATVNGWQPVDNANTCR
jgi:hypothetical protein